MNDPGDEYVYVPPHREAGMIDDPESNPMFWGQETFTPEACPPAEGPTLE